MKIRDGAWRTLDLRDNTVQRDALDLERQLQPDLAFAARQRLACHAASASLAAVGDAAPTSRLERAVIAMIGLAHD